MKTALQRETADELLRRTHCAIWEIDGEFYPIQNMDETTVVDIGGRDAPSKTSGASHWFARRSESGVKYVASGSPTRAAALARIRRAFNEKEMW